jgi:Fe2+ or Zn2+ uptake regulation protein
MIPRPAPSLKSFHVGGGWPFSCMVNFCHKVAIFCYSLQMPSLPIQILQYKHHLRLNHVSDTEPRLKIFEALLYERASTIAELISQLHNQVDKTTIYRTIRVFQNVKITTTTSTGRLELSDLFLQHHHTKVCRSCVKRVRFLDPGLEKALERYQKHTSFQIENHSFELTGLCTQCQNKPGQIVRSAIGPNLRRLPHRL